MRLIRSVFFGLLLCFSACQPSEIPLSAGHRLSPFQSYIPDTYQLSSPSGEEPALSIQTKEFIWDAQGTQLVGATPATGPEQQTGLGLLIENAELITIRNLEIMAYEVAILARNVQSLTLDNCTIHYQKRDLNHPLPEIAGIILENCPKVLIKNCRIAHNQNGIRCSGNTELQLLQDTILGNTQWGVVLEDKSSLDMQQCLIRHHFPKDQEEWLSSKGPQRGAIQIGAQSTVIEIKDNLFSQNTPELWWENQKEKPEWSARFANNNESEYGFEGTDNTPFLLHGPYGPYEYTYPMIWERERTEDRITFLMLGPKLGNWKTTDGYGWTSINPKTGAFPNTLVAGITDTTAYELQLEFIGQAFRLPNGRWNPKGKAYPFFFTDLRK
ncbi:MAG: right-handed parallel beta-helix repeat-containing protein [Bacteroidota bacterium]